MIHCKFPITDFPFVAVHEKLFRTDTSYDLACCVCHTGCGKEASHSTGDCFLKTSFILLNNVYYVVFDHENHKICKELFNLTPQLYL